MKSIHLYMLVFGLLMHSMANAQIQSVTIRASGLTCSMCSRAIYKALQKLPDVAKVQEDIEHSSYQILPGDPEKISLENLKNAVKDAGFSVARMEVKANFSNESIASDSSIKLNGLTFYFVDVNKQVLNGERKILILDKDFLLEKDRRKYLGSLQSKLPMQSGDEIFHVTLTKS